MEGMEFSVLWQPAVEVRSVLPFGVEIRLNKIAPQLKDKETICSGSVVSLD